MPSPLRPTMYGTPSGIALDEGAAEAERKARALRSPAPTADAHFNRTAANAQAESAARRARMAGATPGNAASAAAAESVAAKPSPAANAVNATKTAAQNVGSKIRGIPGAIGRGAVGAGASVLRAGAATAPLAGFGDYEANPQKYGDTSVMGTMTQLAMNNPKGALRSLQGGLYEALGDSARGIGKTVDMVGGMLGGSPGVTPAIDSTIQRAAGDNLALRAPVQAPAADAAAKAVAGGGGAGGSGTPTVPSNTYITGDGRVAQLPAGIKVAYTKDGQPAFGGNAQSVAAAGGPSGAPSAMSASPLRAPQLDNLASGFNQAPSRAGEINKYFDGLAKQIQDLHGSAKFGANGSLATKLLELEKARAGALGQNAGQRIDSQGQQVADLANRRNTEVDVYGIDVGERSDLRRDSAIEKSARIKSQADMLRARQEQSTAVIEQMAAEAARMFPEDPVAQQKYIDSQNRRLPGLVSGDFGVGEAVGATAADRPYVSIRDKANALGKGSDRDFNPTSEAPSRITYGEAMEGTFGDGAGGLGKYIKDHTWGVLPFTDTGKVVRGDDGRMLEYEELDVDEREALAKRQKNNKQRK